MKITTTRLVIFLFVVILVVQVFLSVLYSQTRRQPTSPPPTSSSSSTTEEIVDIDEDGLDKKPPAEKSVKASPNSPLFRPTNHGDNTLDADEEEYWVQYERDQRYVDCENDYGFSLIDRWRKAKTPVCSPQSSIDTSASDPLTPQTTVFCHQIQQSRHSAPDNFCYMENAIVDVSRLAPRIPYGSLSGNCVKDNSKFSKPQYFQLYLNQFMTSFQSHTDKKCAKRVSDKRVVFVQRDGHFNLFHSMTDIINLFIAMLIYHKDIKEEQMRNNIIVILDEHPNGPYWNVWKNFGEVLRLNEFREKYSDPSGPTCFDHLIIDIPGGSNFIWKDCWAPNPCHDSPLLKSFVRFVLKGLGLSKERHRKPTDPIRITFSSRQVKDGGKKVGRKITNEEELEAIIKSLPPLETVDDKKIPVELVRVEMTNLSFEKQVELLRNSDIYMGMHGAGMTHVLWLPDEAVVIELHPKGWHQSSMRNLSKNMGKVYLAWQNMHDKNVIDGPALWTKVDTEEFKILIRAAVQVVLGFHQGSGLFHQSYPLRQGTEKYSSYYAPLPPQ